MEIETRPPVTTDQGTLMATDNKDVVHFTLAFKKQKFDIEWPAHQTVGSLRAHIENLTGVPAPMQKLMVKGLVKNDSDTLAQVGIVQGSKVMLIGSTLNDVVKVNVESDQVAAALATAAEKAPTEPLSEQTKHKKIIEKGPPENVMRGIQGRNDALPSAPIVGVLNNRATNVRLTFKVWSQELWVSSKTNTQQIPFNTVREVESEPIKGHEDYHIVSLQLGQPKAEHTKYYLYWVPAQYVRAIKNTVMGTFDF